MYKDTCKSCELTDRELFKFCKENHKDDFFLRGPDYIKDEEIREKVNHYNLKNKGDKAEIRYDIT